MGDRIISSKLLVLQSKRILLTSAQSRLARHGHEQSRIDVERLESEVTVAHGRYSEAVLEWASPQSTQYQAVAYRSLIGKGERLLASLRRALHMLPATDRAETLAEILSLERIVSGWRSVARATMAETAA